MAVVAAVLRIDEQVTPSGQAAMYADVLRQVEAVVDADPASGLLPRIAAGDRWAMEHFYRQYQINVYRFALAALDDPVIAADVLQAAMIKVWMRAGDYTGGDLTVWLLALTCREIVPRLPAHQRDFAAAQGAVPDWPEQPTDRAAHQSEDVQRVRAALAQLPPGQRLALHLAFAEDMPYDDVADVLDCAEAVAVRLIRDGQRYLKHRLATLPPGRVAVSPRTSPSTGAA